MDSGGQDNPKVVLDTRDAGRGGRRVPAKFKILAGVVLITAIPTLAFFQMAVNTVAYLVGAAPTVTFVAQYNDTYCDRQGCHVATHGITEPGGREYDWPSAVQPGTKLPFPGPVLGPFWPNFNAARPVTQTSHEVILFAALILGYATLAGVTAAIIREETEAAEGKDAEGKKERPVRQADGERECLPGTDVSLHQTTSPSTLPRDGSEREARRPPLWLAVAELHHVEISHRRSPGVAHVIRGQAQDVARTRYGTEQVAPPRLARAVRWTERCPRHVRQPHPGCSRPHS
jgi:hypothetical protein